MKVMLNIYIAVVTYCYQVLTLIIPIFLHKKEAQDRVLYLENFPIENSGYQYRAKKWCEILQKNGVRAEVKTIIEDKKAFDSCNLQQFLLISMKKRLQQCLYARKFKTVIVRRELLQFNDYGNLFMDKFLLKIHPNVILDFDDDIAAAKRQPRKITNLYGRLLRENGNKFNDSLRLYKRFIVGSNYLKNRVLNENKSITENDILTIPTCIDYDDYPHKVYNSANDEVVLGWIGGNHNLHYLDMLVNPLNVLSNDYKFKLVVIAGNDYLNTTAKFKIENKKWNLESEKDLIKSFDIGLMPIEDNAVGRGKCGFKLLQYMGLGVIGIATDVTINGEIIKDGENGFLVKPDNSNWYEVLKKALDLKDKFVTLGENARNLTLDKYTFTSNINKYIEWVF